MPYFPAVPPLPDQQRTRGLAIQRYEDITQDGRFSALAVPHALGLVVWRQLLAKHPGFRDLRKQGVVPILSRFTLEGDTGTIAVPTPIQADGQYSLAHSKKDGDVDKLFLNIWLELSGQSGKQTGPQPPDAGEAVSLGRGFAEHVFTRPFSQPSERRVSRLDAAEMEAIPAREHSWTPPVEVACVPHGAEDLDQDPCIDPAPVVFGIDHTDSNQHVNSLVYPRLFIDAALRQFAAHGRDTKVMASLIDVAYRKPSFAGETLRIASWSYVDGDVLGCVGCFFGDESQLEDGRAHCYLHLRFS